MLHIYQSHPSSLTVQCHFLWVVGLVLPPQFGTGFGHFLGLILNHLAQMPFIGFVSFRRPINGRQGILTVLFQHKVYLGGTRDGI